jgi:transposase-like protein
LDFIAVQGASERAKWERNHSGAEGIENWEYAMIARGVAFDPLEIHLRVRAYIDEWIDTGFFSDGSEAPDSRGFRAGISSRSIGSKAPSARAVLRDLEERIRPKLHFGTRGGITYHPIGFPSPTPDNFAGEIFLEFYCSEWLFRIVRCNRCRVISVPDRKPRKRYERGWHCSKCRNSAAAQAATDAKRAEFREKWFALAVAAYREYMSRPRRPTLHVSAFLMERVNEGLSPTGKIIKLNTITRNLKEIQAQSTVKGTRNNAKG